MRTASKKSRETKFLVYWSISYSCYHRYNYRLYLSIYTALVKRNHSVTMVLPMVERLRNWPYILITKLRTEPNISHTRKLQVRCLVPFTAAGVVVELCYRGQNIVFHRISFKRRFSLIFFVDLF